MVIHVIFLKTHPLLSNKENLEEIEKQVNS